MAKLKSRRLTERREAFCHHYLRTWNSEKAAQAVGLKKDYGRILLSQSDIQARIRELNETMLKASDITAQRVMLELARVAFGDVRGIVDESGRLKPIRELDDDTAATIAGVEVETRYERDGTETDLATGEEKPRFVAVQTAKVKRYDKNPALSILARHFKIVDNEGDGLNALANVLADRLQEARRRTAALPPPGSPDHEDRSVIDVQSRTRE
jgi:phage terminase small subunit